MKPNNEVILAPTPFADRGVGGEPSKVTYAGSRGLGDTVAKITHATGIAQCVEAAAKALNADCGCAKRQDALNKLFPYRSQLNS